MKQTKQGNRTRKNILGSSCKTCVEPVPKVLSCGLATPPRLAAACSSCPPCATFRQFSLVHLFFTVQPTAWSASCLHQLLLPPPPGLCCQALELWVCVFSLKSPEGVLSGPLPVCSSQQAGKWTQPSSMWPLFSKQFTTIRQIRQIGNSIMTIETISNTLIF